jgi:hypothetical protein
MMMELIGKEFDPIIMKVFSNMMGQYPVGTLVLLNTGEIGLVSEVNPELSQVLQPKVKLIADKNGDKIDGDVIDLGEQGPGSAKIKRMIVKSLDPEKYGIRVSDYFLAMAQ